MEAFSAGTLAGAGSFRCGRCGFGVALHERDAVPECPSCGHARFTRASLFGPAQAPGQGQPTGESPQWLEEAREALAIPGDYLAYEDDERVHVVPLQEGWTRVGRSLAADVRFDDPTVSRRHALIVRQADGVRVLDDRSLNGVFVNGERVVSQLLADGDEIVIGRYRLRFVDRSAVAAPPTAGALQAE